MLILIDPDQQFYFANNIMVLVFQYFQFKTKKLLIISLT